MNAHDYRRLQRAVDTINLYGGLMGAADAAKAMNEARDPDGPQVHVPNLQWTGLRATWRISNGRIPVYLAADVQHEMQAQRAAKGVAS